MNRREMMAACVAATAVPATVQAIETEPKPLGMRGRRLGSRLAFLSLWSAKVLKSKQYA